MQIARGTGDILGPSVAEVWPEIGPDLIHIIEEVRRSGQPYHATDAPFVVDRDHGPETIYVNFSFLPLLGPDGVCQRITCLTSDVTTHALALRFRPPGSG